MINKVKNLFIFLFFFLFSIVKLLLRALFSIFGLYTLFSNDSFWFAIFYQPFLVLIMITLFADKTNLLLCNFFNGQGNLLFALLYVAILIIIILLINSLIELLFRLINKNGNFNVFFSIQKTAYNYMMAIISLIAIYAAIDAYNATTINTLLLVYGILIFICILITDLYNALFLSQGIVEKIYNNLQDNYKQHKKNTDISK